jgi:hypothetical protein
LYVMYEGGTGREEGPINRGTEAMVFLEVVLFMFLVLCVCRTIYTCAVYI